MSRNVFAWLLLCNVAVWLDAAAYEGYKLYELAPSTSAQTEQLFQLSQRVEQYDFLTLSRLPKQKVRVVVPPALESQFVAFLLHHGIASKVVNDNVGATLAQEFNENLRLRQLAAATAGKGRLSTERYYNYTEITNYIEDLAVRYPTRVTLTPVGNSYEGRLLKTITVTNGDGRRGKNVIFMDGGFHAREWISHASVLYVIEQLVEQFEQNAELLLDYDWIILPVVNPDGYEHSQKSATTRIWRKTRTPHQFLGRTCYGTDPNRNFDFHWNEEGASSTPCLDTFAGPTAFSEPETIIVRDLMHSLRGRGVMYLTLHSYGNYLLYPWGWTSDLPDTWEDLDEVARAGGDAIFNATGTVYTVGSSTNVLYIAAGASDDYAFYAGFPISITMELPGGGVTGFDPPPSSIDAFVKETWIGITAMAKKVIEKYPTERAGFL